MNTPEIETELETQTENSGVADLLGEVPPVNHRRHHISGDFVAEATAELPEEARVNIRWLHGFMCARNLSTHQLGDLLKKDDGSNYDGNTVYKILTGRHEAKLDNALKSIIALRRTIEGGTNLGRVVINTSQLKRIWDVCFAAKNYHRISFIIGKTQSGKTTALKAYAREHNHGETKYVRMPDGGARSDLLTLLAEMLNVPTSVKDVSRRIIKSFDEKMLLIVDEMHQCFLSPVARVRTVEFLRLLHEDSGCGMVLCGTPIFDEHLKRGATRELLEQLVQRKVAFLRLDDKPSSADLIAFAEHYNLPPATGEALALQTAIIRDDGLGQWSCILQAGAKHASNKRQHMTWQNVIKAHAVIAALEKPSSK